jgi:hypothetical protein
VNKKLELTGTLEDKTNADGPKLRVEAGKVVAASCSEK